MEQNNSYKDSLKATSLFGGVQVFNILIQIVRSKFIAMLIGPEGMGITGLLNSTTTLISSFTNFGLSTSAVRNISETQVENNAERTSIVISVLRRLIWFTGLLGMIICIVISPTLSRLTFGNSDYTFAFILLSVNILLMQLTNGQHAILQGLQKYRFLALANIIGNTIGLFVAVPLYYFWRIDAIVPVLITANLTSFILTWIYCRKTKIKSVPVTKQDIKTDGFNMAKMGILISLQGILSILASYFIRIYIRYSGDVGDVGLYTAGFTLLETYVGLVFTAMATDYYPRLSKSVNDKTSFVQLINNQAEIAIILLAPIVIAFVVFAKLLIKILYSSEFLAIEGMLYWAIAAVLIKALAWSMSYSLLAKGDAKLFFFNELSSVIYGLILNILGYKYFGLTGLGISYLIKYCLYFVQLLVITHKHYDVRLNKKLLSLATIFSLVVLISLLIKLLSSVWLIYSIGMILLCATTYVAYRELNKKVDIKSMITSKLHRS
jgi:PST family polysaccharide transporter